MKTDLGSFAEPLKDGVCLVSVPVLQRKEIRRKEKISRLELSTNFENVQRENFVADSLSHLFQIGVHTRDVGLSVFVDRFLKRNSSSCRDDRRETFRFEPSEKEFERKTILRRIEKASSKPSPKR